MAALPHSVASTYGRNPGAAVVLLCHSQLGPAVVFFIFWFKAAMARYGFRYGTTRHALILPRYLLSSCRSSDRPEVGIDPVCAEVMNIEPLALRLWNR